MCVRMFKDFYMCIFVGAYTSRCMPLLLMHACLDSKKFAGTALMPPPQKKEHHTHRHKIKQCKSLTTGACSVLPSYHDAPPPKEIHLANTSRHKHTWTHYYWFTAMSAHFNLYAGANGNCGSTQCLL